MIDNNICLKGAILGDILGSRYEFYHPDKITLFNKKDFFTDDTILSIATKEAILDNSKFPNFKK